MSRAMEKMESSSMQRSQNSRAVEQDRRDAPRLDYYIDLAEQNKRRSRRRRRAYYRVDLKTSTGSLKPTRSRTTSTRSSAERAEPEMLSETQGRP